MHGTFPRTAPRLWALLIALLLTLSAPTLAEPDAQEPEAQYFENEWNYVEGAMDISSGIPEDAEGALGRVRDSGVLRVATEPYYPPQEFIDPTLGGQDRYVGADMALARLIAQRMGVALEIVPMEFSEVLPAVADGVCDLAISALAYTPGRAAQVTLSKGYHYVEGNTACGLIVREADLAAIASVDDLEGRDVIAQSGSLQEMLMAENVTHYRQFRRASSIREVYDAVRSGLADAATVDIDNARTYIASNPDCALALVPGVRFTLDDQFDGDRIAAKKGELQLMYFVNGVIDEVLASGEYERWFADAERRADDLGL